MNEHPDWILPRADGYVLYFGVPGGEVGKLAGNSKFVVIDTRTWSKIQWRAVDRIEQHGKDKGEYGRAYRVLKSRYLNADECAVWSEYLEQWEAENE